MTVLVREQVLNQPPPVRSTTPEDAVRRYVVAQFTRSSELLRSAVTRKLAEKTGMATFHAPSFGPSSPWVERAEIFPVATTGEGRWYGRVRLIMATSQGVVGTRAEMLEIIQEDGEYRVDEIQPAPTRPPRG